MVKSLVLFVLLDVVEAECEDFNDDLKEAFRPIVFVVFSFHVVAVFGAGYYPVK